MTEETIFEHSEFRKNMGKLGIAEIWITPGIDQRWDVTKGTQQIFETMMKNLSEISGYTELEFAPVIPIGHSAMATYPWNFAAWNPERTLAVLSIHGDSPRTHLTGYGRANLDWGTGKGIDVEVAFEGSDYRIFSLRKRTRGVLVTQVSLCGYGSLYLVLFPVEGVFDVGGDAFYIIGKRPAPVVIETDGGIHGRILSSSGERYGVRMGEKGFLHLL